MFLSGVLVLHNSIYYMIMIPTLRLKSIGISQRKIGIASALPSMIACREFPPTNSELDRKVSVT